MCWCTNAFNYLQLLLCSFAPPLFSCFESLLFSSFRKNFSKLESRTSCQNFYPPRSFSPEISSWNLLIFFQHDVLQMERLFDRSCVALNDLMNVIVMIQMHILARSRYKVRWHLLYFHTAFDPLPFLNFFKILCKKIKIELTIKWVFIIPATVFSQICFKNILSTLSFQ